MTDPEQEPRPVQQWLDALSQGTCNEPEFLQAMQELTQRAPDAGWELLSQLDQYYRLGKIDRDVFRSVKAHWEGQLLGAESEVSVPMPHVDPVRAAAHSARSARRPPTPAAVTNGAAVSNGAAASNGAAVTNGAAVSNHPPIMNGAPASGAPAISAVIADPSRGAVCEIAVGDILRGRYRIKNIVGRGGMATIFEASDEYLLDLPGLQRRVAIKVLHAGARGRSEWREELRREFQQLQTLSHPNIVRVHEYDRDGELEYFTMEYLSGLSIGRILTARQQEPLPRPLALAIIRDVAAALAYAHAHGVVHGDLNPGNIYVTHEGEVRVLDFGSASTPGTDSAPIASPRYASCELLQGEPAEYTDDLYAFACVAYVLLTGRHPFGDSTALQARTARMKPRRPAGLDGAQWRLLRLGLAFDAQRRASVTAHELQRFDTRSAPDRLPAPLALLKGAPPHRRSLAKPALGAALCLLAIAAGWWVSTHQDEASSALSTLATPFEGARTGFESIWSNLRREAGTRLSHTEESSTPAPPTQSTDTGTQVAGTAPAAQAYAAAQAPPAVTPPAARKPAAKPVPATPVPAALPAAPPPAIPADRAAGPTSAAAAAVSPPPPSGGSSPRSRVELAVDTLDVPADEPAARITVRRTGNLRLPANFSWWTESGTAKPGRDFAAVAPHQEAIDAGKGAVTLFVPIVADATRRQPRSFYVVISDPSPTGVSLGARTLTMITIDPAQ
jgi:serine/threonine protein kinase